MARTQSKVVEDLLQGPPGPYSIFNGTPSPEIPKDDDGVMTIRHDDGTVTVDFSPQPEPKDTDEDPFTSNLTSRMSEDELAEIASDLLDGIQRDEDSRSEWLATRGRGISLLGIKLKTPKSDVGSTIEGMSSIDHPLLLEATTNFQATARAELLPASGPVKVRNDAPTPPQEELQRTSAVEKLKSSLSGLDELAQALEKDMNHYLTVTATEYIPDTDRMLFSVGFGGDGFKKVYNCPLRRRPVSESVDAQDLIVSNAATDLKNCGRITHRIKMRPAVLKRMQIMGVYRDVELSPPTMAKQNEVDKTLEEASGIKSANARPKDRDYELYEVYCELDINKFAPRQFKGKGLPLPYRVTIESESRQILDVRRNWEKADKQCLSRQFFVQFPFIRGLGFYGLGYIHLLGNTTITLTAAWREILDAGMYASFPGFLYNKQVGRQLTNQFRVPPGGGIPIDVPPMQKIQDAIMPIPYRDAGAGFVSFITHVEEVGRRLATSGNVAVGEGKQDAPVGTTLALIEQATKVIDSAHKRLHAAQAEEFQLIKARLRDDPESFWRFNKSPTLQWTKDQFIKALNTCSLVPVADPNNPTSQHRIAKAVTIKELQKSSPELYDKMAVDMRVMNIVGIDPQGLFLSKETPAPPDPRMEAIKEKALASKEQVRLQVQDSQLRAQTEAMKIADKQKDRESRERLEAMRIELERIQMFTEGIEKNQQSYADAKAKEQEIYAEYVREHMEMEKRNREEQEGHRRGIMQHLMETARENDRHSKQSSREDERHQLTMQQTREANQERLANARALGAAKVETERAKAKAKPKPKPAAKEKS